MSKPESRTIPALLEEMARWRGDARFLVDGTRRWSYAHFRDAVDGSPPDCTAWASSPGTRSPS